MKNKNLIRALAVGTTIAPLVVAISCGSTITKRLPVAKWVDQYEQEESLLSVIESLNINSLNSLDTNAFASSYSASQVLNALKTDTAINKLSKSQKQLLVESDLKLEADDDNGTLKITFLNHDTNKTILLKGFLNADSVLTETIQKLNFSSLTSLDLNAVPSTYTNDIVLEALKTDSDLKNFSPSVRDRLVIGDVNVLPDDDQGILDIVISNHGASKTIRLSGFLTNEIVLTNKIKDLNFFNLISLSTSALPDTYTLLQVLSALKSDSDLKTLTDVQLVLLVAGDLDIHSDNDHGTLIITIKNHGSDKIITLSGFLTLAQKTKLQDEKGLEDAIQYLNLHSLASLNTNALPNYYTDDQIYQSFLTDTSLQTLTPSEKALFLPSDLEINKDDATGTIIVTIKNHGNPKIITLNNFLTTATAAARIANANALEAAISALNFTSLSSLSITSLATAFDKAAVIQALKTDTGLSHLAPEVIALLLDTDIQVAWDDQQGTIDITISNHGSVKSLNLVGFLKIGQKQAQDNLAALDKVVQSLTLTSLTTLSTNVLPSAYTDDLIFKALITDLNISDNSVKSLLLVKDVTISKDDATGTITLVINGHGPAITLTLNGFLTTAQKQAQTDESGLTNTIQAMSPFANHVLSSTKLPSAFNKAEILNALKTDSTLSASPVAQKNLLVDADITFSPDDDHGTLTITISHHGADKTIKLIGFSSNELLLTNAIKALASSLTLKSLQTSALPGSYTLDQIINALKVDSSLSSLPKPALDMLLKTDLEIVSDNTKGILEIHINNHGAAKTLNLIGYQNILGNLRLLKIAVQGLGQITLNDLSSIPKTHYSNGVTVEELYNAFLNDSPLKNLDPAVKSLLSPKNFYIVDESKLVGSVTVRIEGLGKDRSWVITGFKVPASTIYAPLDSAVQNLPAVNNISDFPGLVSTNYPGSVTGDDLVKALKAHNAFKSLSVDSLNLLSPTRDVTLTPDNTAGTLRVTIGYHGTPKNFTIEGFASKIATDEDVLDKAISALTFSNLQDLTTSSSNLPKLDHNVFASLSASAKDIVELLLNASPLKTLPTKVKGLLTSGDISLTPNNKTGVLDIKISNHGTSPKIISLHGFLGTVALANYEIAKWQFTSLNGVPTTELASHYDAKYIFDHLKSEGFINNEWENVTDLLTQAETNIVFDDVKGNITITISGHSSQPKVITLTGFVSSKDYLDNKIQTLSVNPQLPSLSVTKLPSEFTDANILAALKSETDLKNCPATILSSLLPTDFAISKTDATGVIAVTIKNHGNDRTLTFNGFATTASRAAQQKNFNDLQTIVQGWSFTTLTSLLVSNLPSTYDAPKVLAALKTDTNLKSSPDAVKDLLVLGDLQIVSDDTKGDLTITIKGHGNPKSITLHTFLTTAKKAENDDKAALAAKVAILTGTSLPSLSITKLPSTLTKAKVLSALKVDTQISTLTANQKNYLLEGDITLTPDDDAGTLSIAIANHGVKTLNISGLLTNIQNFNNIIKDLNMTSLPSLKINNFCSEYDFNAIFSALLKDTNLKNLAQLQKDLLSYKDVTVHYDNDRGILTIYIKNHGDLKVITLLGFVTAQENNDAKNLYLALTRIQESFLISSLNHFLPSQITINQFLNTLKTETNLKYSSDSIKNLLTRNCITLTSDDVYGSLFVKITVPSSAIAGSTSKIVIFHLHDLLMAPSDSARKERDANNLDAFMNQLLPAWFNNPFWQDQKIFLPHVMTKELVIEGLRKTSEALSNGYLLTESTWDLLTASDITLTHDDAKGELSITIKNHSATLTPKTIKIPGFFTTVKKAAIEAVNLEDALTKSIQGMVVKTIPSKLFAKKVLPSLFSKIDALKSIKIDTSLKTLDVTLLSAEDLDLHGDDSTGEVQITIHNHGADVTLTLTGLSTTTEVQAELNLAVSKLTPTSPAFAALSKTLLPSQLNGKIVWNSLMAHDFNNLSNASKMFFSTSHITISNDDSKGSMEIVISHFGNNPDKHISLSGFQVTSSNRDKHEHDLTDAVQKIPTTPHSLSSLDPKLLPSLQTHAKILAALLSDEPFLKALSPDSKQYLVEDDLIISTNDVTGTLSITINHHGADRTIVVNGLKTKPLAETPLSSAIQSLQVNSFSSLSKTVLPIDISPELIIQNLLAGVLKSLDDSSKSLLVSGDITLLPDNAKGNLVVIIKNHGAVKTIDLTGFVTEAINDPKVLEEAIQSLSFSTPEAISHRSLPSEVTKTQFLQVLLKATFLEKLTPSQKALLLESDITLTPNDKTGVLDITINGHGAPLHINLPGFFTTAFSDKEAKIRSQISKLTEQSFTSFSRSNEVLYYVDGATHKLNAEGEKAIISAIFNGSNLPKDVQDFFDLRDVLIIPDNLKGILKIIINDHGPTYYITLSGFNINGEQELTALIQNSGVNPTWDAGLSNLPATETITPARWIKSFLGTFTAVSSLPTISKNRLVPGDVTLSKNGDTLVVTVSNHGRDRKYYFRSIRAQISDNPPAFTTTPLDLVALNDKLKLLVSTTDVNWWQSLEILEAHLPPTEITRNFILNALLNKSILKNLTPAQKSLLVESDIALTPDDTKKELTVTILNHATPITFTISWNDLIVLYDAIEKIDPSCLETTQYYSRGLIESFNTTRIIDVLKRFSNIKNLTPYQQKLLTPSMFLIKPPLTLWNSISDSDHYKNSYSFFANIIFGFKNEKIKTFTLTAYETRRTYMFQIMSDFDLIALPSLDRNKLPSQVALADIWSAISADHINSIWTSLIRFAPNSLLEIQSHDDAKGTVTIRINHADRIKIYVITGFKTTP